MRSTLVLLKGLMAFCLGAYSAGQPNFPPAMHRVTIQQLSPMNFAPLLLSLLRCGANDDGIPFRTR
jgi:hypothetical protein